MRVERESSRWTAIVDLPGAVTRRFDGATCDEVLDAAALVLALALDLSGGTAPPAAEPRPAPPTPAEPDPVRVSRRVAPSRSDVEVRVRAGGLADAGTLPVAAYAATTSASIWRRGSGLEISFAVFHPAAASVPSNPGEVAPVGLWTIGMRACRQAWPIVLCAGGEAGRMAADAGALAEGESAGALWSAGSASGWIGRRIGGPARVYGGVEGLATLTRPRFILDDDTSLHRPSPVAVRVLVGLELDVW